MNLRQFFFCVHEYYLGIVKFRRYENGAGIMIRNDTRKGGENSGERHNLDAETYPRREERQIGRKRRGGRISDQRRCRDDHRS